MQKDPTNLLLAFFAGKIGYPEYAQESLGIIRELLLLRSDERSGLETTDTALNLVVQIEDILGRLFQKQLISPEYAVMCKTVIDFAKLCVIDPKAAEKFVLPAVQAFVVFVNAIDPSASIPSTVGVDYYHRVYLAEYTRWQNNLIGSARKAEQYGYSFEKVLSAANEKSKQFAQIGKLGGLLEASKYFFDVANTTRKKHIPNKIDSYITATAEKLFTSDSEDSLYTSIEELANTNLASEPLFSTKKIKTLAAGIKGYFTKEKLTDNQAFTLNLIERVNEMEQRLAQVEHSIEKLNSKILLLEASITGLKERDENIEHKIALMNKKIDDLHITKEQLDGYRDVILSWMNGYNYNRLNEFSKDYLTQAEFLSEHYTTAKFDDFSVVVLQFCRALENELLHKLYLDYARNLINRNIAPEQLFVWDLSMVVKNDRKITYSLAKEISAAVCSKDTLYLKLAIGQMEKGIEFALSDNLRLQSGFASDFYDYLKSCLDAEVLAVEYLQQLAAIREQFRNKAAHLGAIRPAAASIGKKLIRNALNQLLDGYRVAS